MDAVKVDPEKCRRSLARRRAEVAPISMLDRIDPAVYEQCMSTMSPLRQALRSYLWGAAGLPLGAKR
jgi:hypothetical protein